MNDQTHKDKGFLREKLGNYQVNPPEAVWESISDHLGGGRSRRNMLILVFAAAASLALAVTLGIHYFGPDLPQDSGLASEPAGLAETAENEASSSEELSPLEEKVIETLEATELERSEPQQSTIDEVSLARQDQIPQDQIPQDQIPKDQTQEDQAMLDQFADHQDSEEEITDAQPMENDQSLENDQALENDRPQENDQAVELIPDPLTSDPLPDFMEEKKKDVRWMVGVAVSPLYSFRDAEARVMAGAGVHESGILSYSSGVHVNYRRRSRLAFETGIFFNKTGLAIGASGIQAFNQQSDYLVFGAGSERAEIKAVTNSVGNIISNSGEIFVNGYKMNAQNSPEAIMDNNLDLLAGPTSGIEQHLDYLELPFNLRYTVIDRAFELQLVGGVSTNFLVNNYVTMQTSSGQQEIGYLSNIRSVNYSGNAGLGMIYHVGKKLNLMLEPRFRYFLNSVNDSSLPATRPYSIGLYTSLNFTF